jgi:exopolyphosphatase / guanosine-5'-triphosphate,3'-diphosphate pyrophosphatase
VSLQLGCVRLTERYLHGDPPTGDERAAAEAHIHQRLDEADRVLGEQGASLHDVGSLIGVAGTSTTLAALHLGLDTYREEAIHGTRIPAADLVALATDLVARTAADARPSGRCSPVARTCCTVGRWCSPRS